MPAAARNGDRAGATTGFAVVDVETTGFSPVSDRVVEVAVVHLTPDARITGEFATLINPCRDVGSTRVHGITASDVAQAPTFAVAAAAVWGMLAGRVLVAHNASFDRRFLAAEFRRCGVALPEAAPVMCTMQMSRQYLARLPSRTLEACCRAAGIDLTHHHSALADTRATALLLARYRASHRRLPDDWDAALTEAARTPWVPAPRPSGFRPVTRHPAAGRGGRQGRPA